VCRLSTPNASILITNYVMTEIDILDKRYCDISKNEFQICMLHKLQNGKRNGIGFIYSVLIWNVYLMISEHNIMSEVGMNGHWSVAVKSINFQLFDIQCLPCLFTEYFPSHHFNIGLFIAQFNICFTCCIVYTWSIKMWHFILSITLANFCVLLIVKKFCMQL